MLMSAKLRAASRDLYFCGSSLVVVSATFLLDCFVSLKESTCGASQNVFYLSLKDLVVFDIINFRLFGYSHVITLSNA